MKKFCVVLLFLLPVAPAAFAQVQEEVEDYVVAPFTLGKEVTVTAADGRKLEGTVIGGDDQKILVREKTGGQAELATNQIVTVKYRRPRRSTKIDFAGNLIGGIGLGFGGAALGRHVAENVRDDGSPGRAGPIVGGVTLGFAGGFVGRELARRAAGTEEVTLKVVQGSSGRPPKTGSIILPASPPSARVQPADLRR